MRKPIKEAIRLLVESRKDSFWSGDCKIRKGKGAVICEVWHASARSDLFFVSYRAHPNNDGFGVEIGWNRESVLPKANIGDVRYFDFFGGALQLDAYIIGLPLVSEGSDRLWMPYDLNAILDTPSLLSELITEEQAMDLMTPLVDESIRMFQRDGVSYFSQRAAARQ